MSKKYMILLCLFTSTYSMQPEDYRRALELTDMGEEIVEETDQNTDMRLDTYAKMQDTLRNLHGNGAAALEKNRAETTPTSRWSRYWKIGAYTTGITGALIAAYLLGNANATEIVKEVIKEVPVTVVLDFPLGQ